ncbi:MAG: hypothetical protein SV201_15700 [Pseudomonadota bacterium]|nr:hypothetical protein [Pseudomonadota bacterium]
MMNRVIFALQTFDPVETALLCMAMMTGLILVDWLLYQKESLIASKPGQAVAQIICVGLFAVLLVVTLQSYFVTTVLLGMARVFAQEPDVAMATLWVVYATSVSIVRLLGARSLQTLFQRLVMGAQRIVTAIMMAVIAVVIWRSGTDFWGAPLFIALAILAWWSLRSGEARIDRRDRLTSVVRRYM